MNLNTVCGKEVEVSQIAFGKEFNEPLVHQVIQTYLSNGKKGVKAQKNRSEVAGGGRKPWRQKGSGRARAGTRSSPIWVGGGVTFAARPIAGKEQKINKKMYKSAINSILSELLRQDRLLVIEALSIELPKTKLLKGLLNQHSLDDVLIVVDEVAENLELSARNIPKVSVVTHENLDPVSLISYKKVLMTLPAVRKLEECYG